MSQREKSKVNQQKQETINLINVMQLVSKGGQVKPIHVNRNPLIF